MSDYERWLPDVMARAAKGVCDGNCDRHSGLTKAVRVVHKGTGSDWGYFSYCEEAIGEDLRRGLTVTDAETQPQASA